MDEVPSRVGNVGEETGDEFEGIDSTPPPEATPEGKRSPGNDRRYASLTKAGLPLTESLKETGARAPSPPP